MQERDEMRQGPNQAARAPQARCRDYSRVYPATGHGFQSSVRYSARVSRSRPPDRVRPELRSEYLRIAEPPSTRIVVPVTKSEAREAMYTACTGNLLRSTPPTGRGPRKNFVVQGHCTHRRRHVRLNPSWRDRVDLNVVRRKLDGHCLRQLDDRSFRCAVGGDEPRSKERVHTRYETGCPKKSASQVKSIRLESHTMPNQGGRVFESLRTHFEALHSGPNASRTFPASTPFLP